MALAIESFGGAGRNGRNLRPVGRRALLAGAAAATLALAASAWLVATLAAMQTVTAPVTPASTGFHAFPEHAPLASAAPPAQRLIHVSKFSRLPLPQSVRERMTVEAAKALVSEKLVALLRAKAMPAPEPVQVAALPPAPAAGIHPEAVPAVVETAAVAPAPEPRPSTAGPRVAEAAPVIEPPREVASAVEIPVDVQEETPFELVLVEPSEAPVPMARPASLSRAPAAPASRRAEPVLAYAPTVDENDDDEVPRVGRSRVPGLARGVAVYDIEGAVVYLPSGERLEAHSGLGQMRDKPRYANQRMRGPTPPHTYDLTMRESLFHGVEAIRLTPIGGEDAIHGRNGLLAHTYMLGKGGDSNGCVSFKDYRRFLAAYKRGEVRRLIVVPRLETSPTSRFAALFGARG